MGVPKSNLAGQEPTADDPEEDFLEHTRRVWQPHYSRELTREDARQIARNVCGFFETLARWAPEQDREPSQGGLDTACQPPATALVTHAIAKGVIGPDNHTGMQDRRGGLR